MTFIPPILRDFPDQFETERLLIRAPRPGDGAALNAAVVESFPELQPWIPWATIIPTLEDSEATVRRNAARFLLREDLTMQIIRQSDGILLGGIGLHRINWNVPRFEVGYWLRTSAHGQGYVTEAVNGITRFAFEHLSAERLEIRCDPRNEKSVAVARRVGYTQEGFFRRDFYDNNDQVRDTYIFAMIRKDYLRLSDPS